MTDVLQPSSATGATSSTAANGTAPAWPEGVPMRMTFDEFLTWDQEGVRAEWVAGEVVLVSPVRANHQYLMQFFYELIIAFVREHGLGKVLLPPMLMRLPERPSGREPDLMFIAAARAERIKETYVDGAADLVIEIVSPESEARDRATKFLEYEAAGVPEYWLVDPLRHEALFYLLGEDGRYHLFPIAADGIYHSQALAGFRLLVDWLWRDPLPEPAAALRELPV